MTTFSYVLAILYYFCCSFSFEALLTVKMSKSVLGDCSINRRVTNTEHMMNDVADFW